MKERSSGILMHISTLPNAYGIGTFGEEVYKFIDFLELAGPGVFEELHDSLLQGATWHRADHYFILKDFEDYRKAQERVDQAYRNELGWAKKCWINMVNAGKFSSDRTIRQYAEEIWDVRPVE